MSLYRLDYIDSEGNITGPVKDPLLGRDFLSHHATTARNRAIQRAAEHNSDVLITRIGKAGQMKPTLVIRPDGSAGIPPGMKPITDCKKGTGVACFCLNCRAERRAR